MHKMPEDNRRRHCHENEGCCDECDYLICCTNFNGLCDRCFEENNLCPEIEKKPGVIIATPG